MLVRVARAVSAERDEHDVCALVALLRIRLACK